MFDRISRIDSSRLVKTNRNFLSAADRADLVEIARDGLEEHRIARRANALLLLDRGWSFAEVAEALFIDDSTIRIWLKEFQEGGVEALVLFDLKGGASALSPLQIDELRAWATKVLPTSTTEVGQFIMERFGRRLWPLRTDQADEPHRLRLEEAGIRAGQDRRGNPAKVHRRARGFAQLARSGRDDRLRRRRPSDPPGQARWTLAAARTTLRASLWRPGATG